MGNCSYTKVKLTGSLLDSLKKRFIAFDTETTGLDPGYCSIIEVGAVLFEEGRAVKSYGSLIHSVEYVPYEAQMVNHISTAMVRSAPSPEKVYGELIDFFGDAMWGDTLLVGHNMTFDMKFLTQELSRRGMRADLLYTDTCALSRVALPSLYNHTQDTVARHFRIQNLASHRAETDAATCGQIMVQMLPILEGHEKVTSEAEKRAAKKAKWEPGEEEKTLCRALAESLGEKGLEEEKLCFQRSGKLVHVRSGQPLFSFNLSGRKPYLLAGRPLMEELGRQLGSDLLSQMASGTGAEEKIYPEALRFFPAPEQMPELSRRLLLLAREAQGSKTGWAQTAIERWNQEREGELYWRPERE